MVRGENKNPHRGEGSVYCYYITGWGCIGMIKAKKKPDPFCAVPHRGTLDKEVAQDRRAVAGWLLWYEERKREHEEKREEILESSPPPLSEVVPVQSGVSDTTGQKGAQLGDLQEAEKWLALAEEIEQRLPWKMQILLSLKRKYKIGVKGRPVRWLIALELSGEISGRLHKDWCIGMDSVDQWWQKIVTYGVILAAKKGLV